MVIHGNVLPSKIQTHNIHDDIDGTDSGGGLNINNWRTLGYGTISNFTVNNVAPGSKILFLIETYIGSYKRRNTLYNNTYKLYGNGVFQENEISSQLNNSVSFFVWGNPTNTTTQNLIFNYECNADFASLKITSIVF